MNLDKCSPFKSGWQWHNQLFSIVFPKNLGRQIRGSHLFTPKYILMSDHPKGAPYFYQVKEKTHFFCFLLRANWYRGLSSPLSYMMMTNIGFVKSPNPHPVPLIVACGEKVFLIIFVLPLPLTETSSLSETTLKILI